MIRRSEEELKTEEVARSHIMKRIKNCPYLVVTADIVARAASQRCRGDRGAGSGL